MASAADALLSSVSNQFATGSWLAKMVDLLPCLSSMISIRSSTCSAESFLMPKSSRMRRSNCDNRSKSVSIRPTTDIKPLYTTIATVTMNLIVSAAIVLLNPYVTVYISYKIPPFALSVHIPDVSTSIYVEVDSKVLLGLPSCDKAFVR